VHPNDERHKQYVGRELEIESVNGPLKVKVIADELVDPTFGTGVVKVTPAHDLTTGRWDSAIIYPQSR
jgi:valyl-tRNA synthetase